jgi:hypothetical protein
MAHYAKLGIDNVVLTVLYVDNIDCMTRGGIEKEEIGLEHLIKHHGHENWKKCSYSTQGGLKYDPNTWEPTGEAGFRGNYPGEGWYYNSEHDIFHEPRPRDFLGYLCESWTLNTTTALWEPPLPEPKQTEEDVENGMYYRWDESLHKTDNTKGWRLITHDMEFPPS